MVIQHMLIFTDSETAAMVLNLEMCLFLLEIILIGVKKNDSDHVTYKVYALQVQIIVHAESLI